MSSPPPAVGWYATVVLAGLYWLSVLDRFIISLLVDPIKADLGLTDVQFGMLHGFAFVGSFTLFGLIFGALADRHNRRKLIFIGVAIWSVATAACGVAQNYWHLLLARVGVGVGEASLNPSATSMITDLFPREKLTTAMAVYAIGATVGSGTALIIGGDIVGMVSEWGVIHVPLIGALRPWQAVFFIVGIPGSVLGLIIFSVPEPVRQGVAVRERRGIIDSYLAFFRFVRTRAAFFLCHYVGFTLASAVVAGGVAWYPAHVIREFGWSPAQVGTALGTALLISGIVSKLVSGRIADVLYQRGHRDAQLRWYGICLLLATPVGVGAALSDSAWTFIIGIAAFMTFMGALQACALTALNLVTPNELRGTGVAVFTIVMGMIGGGLGPLLIAQAAQVSDAATLGTGLAVLIAICCPLGGVCLLAGLGAMRAAMADAENAPDRSNAGAAHAGAAPDLILPAPLKP